MTLSALRRALIAFGWLAATAVASLLPDLRAALPVAAYYFRDFTLTFFPLRAFQASELAQGRWPFWNPYVHEGEFLLPSFYPPDLLHVLDASPEFISWLLTLHLPLAALGMFALLRGRALSPLSAFAGGTVYAIGGFALSTLNLYSFLQALALAPWMILALQKAAASGGRWLAGAALALAIALSTLAVELVVQALLVGALLVWLDGRAPARGDQPRLAPQIGRLAVAALLGIGLAALPVAITLGILPETARGAGLATAETGGLSIPPIALLQSVMPNFYMRLARPFEGWWGGAIFTDGPPYFLSIYVGVLTLAAAVAGLAGMPRRHAFVLGALCILGGWYALGPSGGVWQLVHDLPFAQAFRTPAKAFFMTHVALAMAVGYGIERLQRAEGWRIAGLVSSFGAILLVGLWAGAWLAAERIGHWLHLDARAQAEFAAVFPRDAALTALIAAGGALVAGAAAWRRIQPHFAAVLMVAVIAIDLARAGAGLNPQAPRQFFELLPGIAAERLDRLDGGRVFVYPATRSRQFRAWLDERQPDGDLWAFYANRQQLDPYNNVVDRIETAVSSDRTRFSPLLTELGWTGYEPENIALVLPYLRHAGVSRITSLEPLSHPDLTLRRTVQVARTGLAVHVYGVSQPLPRLRVACNARRATSRLEAAQMALVPETDAQREVVLETDARRSETPCSRGTARLLRQSSDEERYAVESDGAGWLVVRSTHARGWRVSVDDQPANLLRADGRHRAVAIGPGQHNIHFWYEPPWMTLGVILSLLSAIATIALFLRRAATAPPDRATGLAR